MNEGQALTLLAALKAAFPKHPFPPESAALYTTQMLELDEQVGQLAVQELIQTSMWFPSIAEIREEYKRFWAYRPQPKQLDMAATTPEERMELGAEMRQWANERFGVPEPESVTEGLEQADAGRCDDCAGKVRERWRFGKFTLCHGCVTLRRRAAQIVGSR